MQPYGSGDEFHIVRFEGWETRQQYRPGEFNSWGDPKPGAKMEVSIVPFAIGEDVASWADLKEVSRSIGVSKGDLSRRLRSKDPREVVGAIEAVAGYYGWINFDEYPKEMTRTEINKHWGRWLR